MGAGKSLYDARDIGVWLDNLRIMIICKVPEKYGSQEIQSKETKSEEKRHPACEKHNRANHLLAPYVEARPEGGARTEKEISEKV